MLAKSGGLAAILDRKVVTQCPLCDTDNPDLENHGFCSGCGALFREKIQRRLTTVKAAIALGLLLTLVGAALALAFGWPWTGITVFALGIVPLAFGILANRQMAGFLLDALGRRNANDTQRSLRTTDRLAASLLVYFVAAAIGCIPYFLYVERPKQQQEQDRARQQAQFHSYRSRFEGKINEYVTLVADDALPGVGVKPSLSGKAIIVERTASGGQVSEANLLLPPEARAETPEEVGTLVIVKWEDFRRGEYGTEGSGILAYRVDGRLRIIRVTDKSFFEPKQVFEGGPPPQHAPPDGGPGRGPKPLAEIARYIADLERQPSSPATEPATDKPEAPAAKDQPDSKPKPSTKK